jgi:hypothetical protein
MRRSPRSPLEDVRACTGSQTTWDQSNARTNALDCFAFCHFESMGIPEGLFAAQGLAYTHSCQRFALLLTDHAHDSGTVRIATPYTVIDFHYLSPNSPWRIRNSASDVSIVDTLCSSENKLAHLPIHLPAAGSTSFSRFRTARNEVRTGKASGSQSYAVLNRAQQQIITFVPLSDSRRIDYNRKPRSRPSAVC